MSGDEEGFMLSLGLATSSKKKELADKEHYLKFLDIITGYEDSIPFHYPVDGTLIPSYYVIIKNPMDLSIIRSKIEKETYTTPIQLHSDVMLMLNNCFTFNTDESVISQQAQRLKKFFAKEFRKAFPKAHKEIKALESMAVKKTEPSSSQPSVIKLKLPVVDSTSKGKETISVKPPIDEQEKMPFIAADRVKAEAFLTDFSTHASAKWFLSNTEFTLAKLLEIVRGNVLDSRLKDAQDLGAYFVRQIQNIRAQPIGQSHDMASLLAIETAFDIRWRKHFGVSLNKEDILKDFKPTIHSPSPSIPSITTSNAKLNIGDDEMALCKSVHAKLMANQNAEWFLVPVDPVLLHLPDYFEKIKNPMDFGTIQTKLDKGDYASMKDYEADVMLVFDNCTSYNAPETNVHHVALKCKRYFNSIFSKTLHTLQARIKETKVIEWEEVEGNGVINLSHIYRRG